MKYLRVLYLNSFDGRTGVVHLLQAFMVKAIEYFSAMIDVYKKYSICNYR